MGLRLIRGNSDTPNVTNTDDARMVRYAYGGYSGYVQGKGSELDCVLNGNTLTINSGVIVLQGWEVEIDSNGWSMQVSRDDATPRYFTVYCEVNLSMGGAASIKSVSNTVDYPKVKEGDDLTKVTNGIANLELCHFTAQSGVISDVKKSIEKIPYSKNEIYEKTERIKNDLTKGDLIPQKAIEASKINGLPINREGNGLLNVDGWIVPQRMVLWEGNKLIKKTDDYNSRKVYPQKEWKPKDGDIIEIHISLNQYFGNPGKPMVFTARSKGGGPLFNHTFCFDISDFSMKIYQCMVTPHYEDGEFKYFSAQDSVEGAAITANNRIYGLGSGFTLYDGGSEQDINEYYLRKIILIRESQN